MFHKKAQPKPLTRKWASFECFVCRVVLLFSCYLNYTLLIIMWNNTIVITQKV